VSLLTWIEDSAFAEYIRVAPYGYPAMITLHSLGLAIMVGLSVVLSLRALGVFGFLPYEALRGLLKIAWVGFIVNLLSGSALFASQATTYVTDLEFLLKMFFVLLGAIFVALLQSAINRTVAAGGEDAPNPMRSFYASAAIVSWAGAMIAGRLIAYL
jgi:hypothetical protein